MMDHSHLTLRAALAANPKRSIFTNSPVSIFTEAILLAVRLKRVEPRSAQAQF